MTFDKAKQSNDSAKEPMRKQQSQNIKHRKDVDQLNFEINWSEKPKHMEMKDILDIDMGFEDEQLTLYLENIKGKTEDEFKLATASRIYSGQGRPESE